MIVVPFSLTAPLVGGLSPVLRTPQPRSDTELTNKPMAASFERQGYRNFAVRMVATYPLG
jgi:hypothetical protein